MEPESHALWNNRDIITAIMKCTHPEIHNSDKRALCLTSKLLKVCTNEAAKQNAYTLLSPVLNGLRPGIQAYEIEKLIENCMSHTMLCSAEVSPGCLRFSFQYILNCLCLDQLTENMEENMRRMAQNLLTWHSF